MTKSQFMVFKKDLKLSIQVLKLQNKFVKSWKNLGYESEESYNLDLLKFQEKICDLKSQISKRQYRFGTYPAIYADDYHTHWAYYCAKHQLTSEQIEEYCREQFDRLKPERTAYYSFTSAHNNIKEILKFYESIVCPVGSES